MFSSLRSFFFQNAFKLIMNASRPINVARDYFKYSLLRWYIFQNEPNIGKPRTFGNVHPLELCPLNCALFFRK